MRRLLSFLEPSSGGGGKPGKKEAIGGGRESPEDSQRQSEPKQHPLKNEERVNESALLSRNDSLDSDDDSFFEGHHGSTLDEVLRETEKQKHE